MTHRRYFFHVDIILAFNITTFVIKEYVSTFNLKLAQYKDIMCSITVCIGHNVRMINKIGDIMIIHKKEKECQGSVGMETG